MNNNVPLDVPYILLVRYWDRELTRAPKIGLERVKLFWSATFDIAEMGIDRAFAVPQLMQLARKHDFDDEDIVRWIIDQAFTQGRNDGRNSIRSPHRADREKIAR
jgi:hypothetical protein